MADLDFVTQRQLAELRGMLDERYATQIRATEAAFVAQQTAMQTALQAAERGLTAALLSAEKAVDKAEVATDKRFENSNNYRQQLTQQAASFITRVDVDMRIATMNEKHETAVLRTAARLSELSSRMDLTTGASNGENNTVNQKRLDTNQGIAILGVLLSGVAVVVTLFFAFTTPR